MTTVEEAREFWRLYEESSERDFKARANILDLMPPRSDSTLTFRTRCGAYADGRDAAWCEIEAATDSMVRPDARCPSSDPLFVAGWSDVFAARNGG